MTEKEKNILERLGKLLPQLDEQKQERILLLAEDALLLRFAERQSMAN